jgi:hypothetical protein
MMKVLKELVDLCVQAEPVFFEKCDTYEEKMNCFVYFFAAHNRLQTYDEDNFAKDLGAYTLEDCVQAYQNGLYAVINDGRLYGFKNAS